MEKVTFLSLNGNDMCEIGKWWTSSLSRKMRIAYFKMYQVEKIKYGILYYKTTDSDYWYEREIPSKDEYNLNRILSLFSECSEEEFLTSLSEGKIYSYYIGKELAWKIKREEEEKRAESITYVGNKFIYSSHKKMLKPEKIDHYLTNPISSRYELMRSFLIEIESETSSMYRIKLLYLPTWETGWKLESKRIGKKKIKSAYGSRLIVETTDEELAKYYLLLS